MYKTLSVALIAFALVAISPSTAHAAWWNPFSWGIFKRQAQEVPEPRPIDIACTMDARQCPDGSYVGRVAPSCEFAPCPTTTPTTTAPGSAKPSATPPVSRPVVPTPPVSKPTTTPSTSTRPVEVPVMKLARAFTSEGFVAPLSVKSGTEVMSIVATHGSTTALGLWYTDSVTWRIESDTFRSGDFAVAVYSGNRWIEDVSTAFGASHTTRFSGHVASEPISFIINSRVPSRGTFRIVVERVEGSMKGVATSYTLTGVALAGPEFRF